MSEKSDSELNDELRPDDDSPKVLKDSAPGQYATPAQSQFGSEAKMATLSLQPPLADEVYQAARHEGRDAADFLAEAVRQRLAVYRQKRIVAETDAWYRLSAEKRNSYAGKYVAVYDGQVIDSDADRLTLYLRLRERLGREPVLITAGGDQPIPVYRVRSPRQV
jgi:hypothetical protein